MIIPVSFEKILPEIYVWLRGQMWKGEKMDNLTLSYIKKYYVKEFSTGTIVGWNEPHDTIHPKLDIEFESEEDAVLFMLRWS